MKVLVVFVTALVLVAQGYILPLSAPEELAVYEVEEVGDDAGAQSVYAAELNNPEQVQVFGAEEGQRADYTQESQRTSENLGTQIKNQKRLAAELARVLSDGIYLPMKLSGCTDYRCAYICGVLDFANGTCISNTTCHCYV